MSMRRLTVAALCLFVASLARGQSTCAPSFVTSVVATNPGPNSYGNPSNLIGNDTSTSYSPGHGGNVIVSFGNSFSTSGTSAPDICLNEIYNDCYYLCYEPADAATQAALQAAGWQQFGSYWELSVVYCGDQNVDVDALVPGHSEGELLFTSLMVLDSGQTQTYGVDIKTIEAKFVCSTMPPTTGGGTCSPSYATGVASSYQGNNAESSNADPTAALGSNTSTYFSLGKSGNIVLTYGNPVSTSGNSQPDLCVYEFSDNDCYYVCYQPADTFTQNAIQAAGWQQFGQFWEISTLYCGNEDIDIDALVPGYGEGQLKFTAIMILDDGSSGDGAEISALEAKFVCSPPPPGGGDCVPGFASEVISSSQGGYPLSGHADPTAALGDVDATYFSLGQGGNIVLGYGAPVSTSGDSQVDLCVTEWNDNDCYYICYQPADAFTQNAIQAAGWHQNANNFWELPITYCGNENIDIDALVPGFSEGQLQFTAIMVLDDGSPSGDNGAEVIKLEAKFICPPQIDPAKIGDFVWADDDGDGIQDAGEPGVVGVTVVLQDDQGATVATTATDADGLYQFCVPGGTYRVCFQLPTGFAFTLQDQGSNNNLDSDADPADGCTSLFSIADGQIKNKYDAGLVPQAKIGDLVFEDVNGNGLQDAGEPGVPSVTVNLLDDDGTQVQTTVTDGDGLYQFCVEAGTYEVCFVLPTGFEFTAANVGGNEGLDSDADPQDGCADPITIQNGQTNDKVDAGLVALAKIGDFVFEDTNGDGAQSAGEPGVAGVLVTLLDAGGNPTGQTMNTNGVGFYQFCVAPGTYIVQFGLPTGTQFTTPNASGNEATDSDAGPNGQSEPVTVLSGETNNDVDAGVLAFAKIGNMVFEDLNGDGRNGAGEPGVSGVLVTLMDGSGNALQTIPTDGNGIYQFCVAPGTYVVCFGLPNGTQFTTPNSGLTEADDSDADPATGCTDPVTIFSGEINDDVDAGVLALAKLGNFVFEDQNGDGLQGAGEPGVAMVPVTLLDAAGSTTLQTTSTDGTGFYQFCVEPGTYRVQFGLPTGFQFTTPDAGNDAADSDADPANGLAPAVTVQSGETNNTIDAGILALAKLGNFVFEDLNGDGLQGPGEPGVANVPVTLLNDSGSPTQTTSTDVNGIYVFCVEPGTYSIQFGLPTGFEFTAQDAGNDALDSDASTLDGTTAPVTLTSGQINNDIDAGLVALAKLGNFVFEDLNGNGLQDGGEPGIANAIVTLLDANGSSLGQQITTGADGAYQFCIDPGTYRVSFTLPGAFQFTLPNAGDDALDSDADPNTGISPAVTLQSGETNNDVDAGAIAPAKLGNFVFEDLNGDGLQGANEPGVGGVSITLLDGLGNPAGQTTVTDGTGFYQFCVDPGTYIVAFTAPLGTQFTVANAGGDLVDSDADEFTGRAPAVTVQSGQIDNSIDAGILALAKVGNFVFEDQDGDGLQDAGEPGVSGVTVTLFFANGTPAGQQTMTDGTGIYQFCVDPGDYYVAFSLPVGFQFTSANAGVNDAIDSDADPMTGITAAVSVQSGDINNTLDAGLVAIAKLGDFVFEDLNADGIQSAGEPGVSGIMVTLLDGAGASTGQQTMTDADGLYQFCVVPGQYIVAFSLPSGLMFTTPNVGNDGLDSDADPMTGLAPVVTILSGEMNFTIDAGVVALAKLGNFVFEDLNGNGLQDAGEPGVGGVQVGLLDANGNAVDLTTTDGTGFYQFCVDPGTYIVAFGLPTGFMFTTPDAGPDDVDSDANPANGRTGLVTLQSGEINNDVDAGLLAQAKLGNFVFVDLDGDGIQDSGEPGVPGVMVTLFDGNGTPTGQTTTTDGNGLYQFCVNPGTYIVGFGLPAGFSFTTANAGMNDAVDSDADPISGLAPATTVISGQFVDTIDAGLVAVAKLGNFVFEDLNANGLQDPSDPGVAGVTVALLDGAGVPLGPTTMTDANGLYEFCVDPGSYSVQFTAPMGRVFTVANAGTDDGLDSDADPMTGITPAVFVPSGAIVDTVDAGLVAQAKIGDRVFADVNCDGIQDANEAGIAGVPVTLLDMFGQFLASTVTDALGVYEFCVEPGTYQLSVAFNPNVLFLTTAMAGTDPTLDSDFDPGTATTGPITVTSGQIRTDIDAGFCIICNGPQASVNTNFPACGSPFDPILTATLPIIGSNWKITIDSVFPNQVVIGYVSFGPPIPVLIPGTTCFVYVDFMNPLNVSEFLFDLTDANGDYCMTFPLPANPAFAGLNFNIQVRVCAPGFPSPIPGVPDWPSNGLHATIGCP